MVMLLEHLQIRLGNEIKNVQLVTKPLTKEPINVKVKRIKIPDLAEQV